MTNKLDNKAAFENDAAFNQEVFVNMDLVPCPVCGHLCSRDALTCPKCGKPLAKKNKALQRALETEIPDEVYQELEAIITNE